MKELKESRFVRKDGSKARRWFSNEGFDLIVWYGADDEIVGFQLCYEKERKEKALTWKKLEGYSHSFVDSGESSPHKNMTPVLRGGGKFEKEEVIKEFSNTCASIDPVVSAFVLQKLRSA